MNGWRRECDQITWPGKARWHGLGPVALFAVARKVRANDVNLAIYLERTYSNFG